MLGLNKTNGLLPTGNICYYDESIKIPLKSRTSLFIKRLFSRLFPNQKIKCWSCGKINLVSRTAVRYDCRCCYSSYVFVYLEKTNKDGSVSVKPLRSR